MAERYSQEWCDKMHGQIDGKIQMMESAIYGNGREGLITKVAKIEADMPTLKADSKMLQRNFWIGLGVVIVLQPVLTALLIKSIVVGK